MIRTDNCYEERTFKSLDLQGKSLQRCVFDGVIFERCNFQESDWSLAQFNECQFKNCNLSLVNLRGARLQQVVFEGCKIVGLEFCKCEKFLHNTFDKCALQTCNFADLKLKGISFSGSKIREVYFTNTDLTQANFTDTDLLGTLFHQCNLTKADFRNAKNYGIDLQTNTVKQGRFSYPEAMELLKSFDIEIT